MFTNHSERIFDTLIDTNKKYVSMIKVKFYLRKDYKTQNSNLVCVSITKAGYDRVRFGLELYVDQKYWDDKKQSVKVVNQELLDKQLILDNIKSKFTKIITNYRLDDRILTPMIARDEYENKISRINFIAFFNEALQEEKSKFTSGTYARHLAVYKKLKEYKSYVPFNELNISWFNKYRNHLKDKLNNKETTINGNFASIKKFLGIAKKNGVRLAFNLDEIEIGSTTGNRNYLNADELVSLMEFYFSRFIKPEWKLILGYFLFACMNGLRITNVLRLRRDELLSNDVSLVMIKGNKDRTLALNNTVKRIINNNQELFSKKVSQKHINEEIKKIAVLLGITKKISFHCSRHTFAMMFLKMGGKVEELKELLGHSDIKQTMIYVHMSMEEANEKIFLLDKLFSFEGEKFIA